MRQIVAVCYYALECAGSKTMLPQRYLWRIGADPEIFDLLLKV